MRNRYRTSIILIGFLTLQLCYTTNLPGPLMPQLPQATLTTDNTEETAELSEKVHFIVNNLISLLNSIISRIDSLSIETEIKRENTDQLLSIQDKLLKIKKNLPSYSNNKEKLIDLLELLSIITQELEKGLEASFSAPLSFTDTQSQKPPTRKPLKVIIDESKKAFSKIFSQLNNTFKNAFKGTEKPATRQKDSNNEQDPIKKLLLKTEEHLLESEKLMQNLGKTWVNTTYGKFTGWWNTPLFHIAPLGNIPVYPGSIAKRVVIYGFNTVLVIYNLNQNFINEMPIPWLRNSLTKIKSLLGKNVTQIEQNSPGTQQPATKDNEFVVLDGNSPVEIGLDHGKLLARNTDGSLKFKNKAPLYEKRDGKDIEIGYTCTLESGVIAGLEIPFDSTKQSIQHAGSLYSFTSGNKTEYITATRAPLTNKRLFEHQTDINIPGTFIPEEKLPKEIYDQKTQKFYNHKKEELKPTKRLVYSPILYDPEGNPVSPTLVYRGAMGIGAALSQKKYPLWESGLGYINKAASSVSFIFDVDLKTAAFTMPIAGWLSSYIYEDMAELKHNIPNIMSWIHGKLSGAEPKLEAHFSVSDKTFDDVIGRNSIKEKLMPYIKFVENPKLAIQAGINVPRGIIFAGEPQTGKTLMAKAFLGELSHAVQKQGGGRLFRMIEVKVNELVHLGLKPYLEYMKQFAPCLVFCDEFELTGAQRDQNRQLLAEFLTALAGFGSSEDIDKMVFFLVATNHPENIDHALQEPGRMGTHIYFEMPTAHEREEFFIHYFEKKKHIPTIDLNISELVRETAACSFGSLQDIASGISRRAEYAKESLSQAHIDRTLDEMVRRIVTDEYDMPQEQRIALAARYGAQAFTSLVLNPNKKFVAATIYKITPDFKDKIAGKNYELLDKNKNYAKQEKKVIDLDSKPSMIYGGFFSYNTHETFGLISNDEKLKLCKIYLAGTVGQEVLGLPYMDFDADMVFAHKYAREIVLNGMKEEWLSEQQRNIKSDQVLELITRCKQEIKVLLEKNKPDYEKIVDLLQKRYIIRTSDIKQCFDLKSFDLTSYFTRPTIEGGEDH